MDAERDDNWDGRLCILECAGRLYGHNVREKVWALYGGREVYVATTPRPDCELAQAIGHAHALAIGNELGGTRVSVPVHVDQSHHRRRSIVLAASLAQRPIREIARQAGCTEHNVYIIRRRLRDDGELPPLRLADRSPHPFYNRSHGKP